MSFSPYVASCSPAEFRVIYNAHAWIVSHVHFEHFSALSGLRDPTFQTQVLEGRTGSLLAFIECCFPFLWRFAAVIPDLLACKSCICMAGMTGIS